MSSGAASFRRAGTFDAAPSPSGSGDSLRNSWLLGDSPTAPATNEEAGPSDCSWLSGGPSASSSNRQPEHSQEMT
jgi:hypothetical protein